MTEAVGTARMSESLVINFLRVRNLRGTKGDQVSSTLKVEFADKVLGESPKMDCSPDTEAEFNFQVKLPCSIDDVSFLDEICYKPVLCTVTEVLPKEKKQKDEKTVPLGQVSFDLLAMVRGATRFNCTLPVHPIPGSPLESLPPDAPKPELDILLTVDQPLIGEALQQETNLVGITVESLFSPPDSFNPSGPQGGYVAATAMPYAPDRDLPIVFINGNAKATPDKEPPSRKRRWYLPGTAQGQAVFMPGQEIGADPVEAEDGDLRTPEEREFRQAAEAEKSRVTWNTTKNCFVGQDGLKVIQDRIARTRIWPVEIFRLNQGSGARGKKQAEEDGSIGFHGVAYVNASPLLYPGVTRIRGAYRVYPYMESEYCEKTKRKSGLGEEAGRIAVNYMYRASATPTGKKGDKGAGAAGDKKAGGAADKAGAAAAAGANAADKKPQASKAQISESEEVPANPEGQQYLEHKSYVMIEICLDKPLVPKRTPEEMAKRVAEYIPARPMYPKRTNSAEKALGDYHQQVAEISGRVLEEFRSLFADSIRSGQLPLTPDGIESMRQELMYSLNASGKYFAFKEQLKYAVIKVVREKYLKTTGFQDQAEMQLFLRDLFVYLVDQLQVGMRKAISLQDRVPVPAPVTDSEQLLHFAREAEVNENLGLAQQLYQERIARDRLRPQHWYDYGVFSLSTGDVGKAEECFRETVSLEQTHLNGLMMLGVVTALQERHQEAQTYLEAATAHRPDSLVAWTLLLLYYDSVGNDIGAEMSLLEANRINAAEAAAKQRAEKEAAAALQAESGVSQLHLIQEEKTADLLGDQPALAQQPPPQPPLPQVEAASNSAAGNEQLQHSDNKLAKTSQVSKSQANTTRKQTPSVKAGKNSSSGTPAPTADEAAEAAAAAAEAAAAAAAADARPPAPTQSVFMRAANFLIANSAVAYAERALAHEVAHLRGSGRELTPDYFLAHARLSMQQRQFETAEVSLNDLLQLAPTDANGWALMGHLKYLVGYVQAARDCYQRVLALTTDPDEPHPVILRLASIHLQLGDYRLARETFLLACKRSPSAVSWLGVGIACYRLGDLQEAEDALAEANLLNNRDPEVWAYLSLICLRTGRRLEAEQTYKYAVKVGLEDELLISELRNLQSEVGFGDPSL